MEGWDKTKPGIVVVCGPTASGKTKIALDLCRRFNGELVSADSMQIYQGLTVGTAAVTQKEADGVPVHMTGFLPPEQAYSVAEYVSAAHEVIGNICARGRLPVVCGGTGLYVSSLVQGLRFTAEKSNPQLRARLQAELDELGPEGLLRRLAQVDSETSARLSPADGKRIVRALELWELTGKTYAQLAEESKPKSPPYNALCFGLTFTDRQILYERINRRVDNMLANGLLSEAELVYRMRDQYITAAQAIGYKELFPFFAGEQSLAQCVEKLKQATRNYAKRQLTWFKRMEQLYWLDAQMDSTLDAAVNAVSGFIQPGDTGDI